MLRKSILLGRRATLHKFITLASVTLMLLIFIFGVVFAQAEEPNRVGLVVVHGDSSTITRCIEFTEDTVTGFEVLERSGLDLNYEGSGMGAAICRIDNEGCTYPQEKCFCQSPPDYWSYWLSNAGDGSWRYSGTGASNRIISDGQVDGWRWGPGSLSEATPPPAITFNDICPPLATATPTPTQTPAATHTPQPTQTATPTPMPTPVIHSFTSDQSTINSGESTILRWDLSGAEAAYLQYDDLEEGVVSPGHKTVAPTRTTVYTLVARNKGGETIAEVTVTVNNVSPTPTPVNQLTNQPANTPPPPTESTVPEPVINFYAGAETLPSGACTSLYWEVQNGQTVYLDEVEVAKQGFQEACPEQTQVYTLRVVYPGGERTAQLTLEVVDAIAGLVGTPTVVAITPTTAKFTAPATPPLAEATPISRNSVPTIDLHPAKRNVSPQPLSRQQNVWLFWAKLGIWGGLIGGWCLITAVILIGWAGIWWINKRKIKR
jgi:hypothetical protein